MESVGQSKVRVRAAMLKSNQNDSSLKLVDWTLLWTGVKLTSIDEQENESTLLERKTTDQEKKKKKEKKKVL